MSISHYGEAIVFQLCCLYLLRWATPCLVKVLPILVSYAFVPEVWVLTWPTSSLLSPSHIWCFSQGDDDKRDAFEDWAFYPLVPLVPQSWLPLCNSLHLCLTLHTSLGSWKDKHQFQCCYYHLKGPPFKNAGRSELMSFFGLSNILPRCVHSLTLWLLPHLMTLSISGGSISPSKTDLLVLLTIAQLT